MHEMGIAQSVIDMATREAQLKNARAVLRVSLSIGELSGVDTESLVFCFDCLKQDTLLASAALEIAYKRRRHRCPSCAHEFDILNLELACPQCQNEATQFLSGDELELSQLELELA
ncbi:MAG TPA: hydrogenase maturation nickel metallochaperone HypA [Paludibaculum sp.]|jgi:hydrogenase nickel incorporation protein HypA/HybF